MNKNDLKKLRKRETEINSRLVHDGHVSFNSIMSSGKMQFEVSDRINATVTGGVAAMHEMVRAIGLDTALNRHVHLLKVHKPYFESDHILNIAYNILAGGTCLEDLEILRKDKSYMDALGAERIPDPTTAGDFLRRFDSPHSVLALMNAINEVRKKVWKELPEKDRRCAIIDIDGTIAPTTGECKTGMDMSYKGIWGYHPLVVSLANTREALFLSNRSGNRPSHEGAVEWIERSIDLTKGTFRKVLLRGDSDFPITGKFDDWTERGVQFIFGYDAKKNLINIAQSLDISAWTALRRDKKYICKTEPRRRPENIKENIVYERKYKNIRLQGESYAEFTYRPGKCRQSYRVIVVRKDLSVERGEDTLWDEVRYFFYITNIQSKSPRELIRLINKRCQHENDIEQLKNGVHAMRMPSGDLESNWAYMVIAALAWNLKAWYAILIPDTKTRSEVLRMEFKRFIHGLMRIPMQVIKVSRQLRLRILGWTPFAETILLMSDKMKHLQLE